MTDLPRDSESELAALADGSLVAERRTHMLARVNESPELQASLAEQRRAVEMLASVEVAAPAALHRSVEALLAGSRSPRRRAARRVWLPRAALAAGATALAAAALAVGLSGGGSTLSAQSAAALALSPATLPAPSESATRRNELAVSVGGVSFPYWEERFGWRSVGARGDRLAGRSATTVFYSNPSGERIGYAIVSGAAPVTHGGSIVRRWGVDYRVSSQRDANVVTWKRAGHLCVIAGRGVSAHTLVSLASWGTEKRA
jgi:hypothetical protein